MIRQPKAKANQKHSSFSLTSSSSPPFFFSKTMLDLNLDHVFSIDSACNNPQKRKITHIQDSSSETSSSSIINNSEESTTIEDSSDNTNNNNNNNNNKKQHQVFIFDIMKKNSTTTSQSHDPLLIEQQLFPLNGGSGSSFLTPPRPQFLNLSCGETEQQKQLLPLQQLQQPPKKSRRGPRSRSSQYRGVTFYRRTGRWESHIWDCGKQVYLGGFDTAHAAARAYDRAAIKFRGVEADINFILSDYDEDMKQMGNLNKEDFVHILRRQSTGFLRGNSKYRGPKEVRMAQFGCNNAYGKVEPSVYQPQIPTGAINNGVSSLGVGRNLDLSLRISVPENSTTRSVDNSVLRSVQQPHAAAPMMWNTTFLPSAPNSMEARSSQSVSSWASRMPDNMNITLAPRLPSAASSGFASSSVFSPSPTSLSSNLHNHLANRLHLNTTTAAAHKVSGTSTNQLYNKRS